MYRLLPSNPKGTSQTDSGDETTVPTPTCHKWRLYLFLCIICTIVNAAISVLSLHRPLQSSVMITRKDINLLRRPSQYIRFDEIKRPSPPVPKQFNNYPILIAQIDEENKSKVFGNLSRKYTSFVGTIVPEDKRVFINRTVSTIVQFRAIDFGMETCELRLSLPGTSTKFLLLPEQSFPLSIYRLNATVPLDVDTLSYQYRPARVTKVADIHLSHEAPAFWHRKFRCGLEEVLTFELAYSASVHGNECQVEWWQDKEDPDPAIFLTQHATV